MGEKLQARIGKFPPLSSDELNLLLIKAFKIAYEFKQKTRYGVLNLQEERELMIEEYNQAKTLIIILIDKGAEIKGMKNEVEEYKKIHHKEKEMIEQFYDRFLNLPRTVIISELINNIKVFQKYNLKQSLFYQNFIEDSFLDEYEEQPFLNGLLAEEKKIFDEIELKIEQSKEWIKDNRNNNWFRKVWFGLTNGYWWTSTAFNNHIVTQDEKMKEYVQFKQDAEYNHNMESFFILAEEWEEMHKDCNEKSGNKEIGKFIIEKTKLLLKIRKDLESATVEGKRALEKQLGGYVGKIDNVMWKNGEVMKIEEELVGEKKDKANISSKLNLFN